MSTDGQEFRSRAVVIGIEITVVIGIITYLLIMPGNTPWMTDGESNLNVSPKLS
jgi:hypothetical protein